MIIATGQYAISSDIGENTRQILDLQQQAAAKGARLLHLPEASLSGYPKNQFRSWEEVEWKELAKALTNLCTSAAKYRIWTVAGSYHPNPDGLPFNSLYVISDQGKIEARYDKRICSHTERTQWFSQGSQPTLFKVDGFRFGCALCIEIHFPELFSEYADLEADCILLSSYSNDPIFEVTAQSTASSQNVWFSHAVADQDQAKLHSTQIGPDGHILTTADTGAAFLLTTRLNRTDPKWEIPLQRAKPWRRQARADYLNRRA